MSEKMPSERVQEEEVPTKGFFKNVRNYFREYCQCTGVHGFRYFGEKRTVFERVWWFFVFVICLSACSTVIYWVYQKWEQSPVIVTFATKGTTIVTIPFPAVTICPEMKAAQTVFNYTHALLLRDQGKQLGKIQNAFECMTLICDYPYRPLYTPFNFTADEFYQVLDTIKPNLTLIDCFFLGQVWDCSRLFKPIITDEGVCYTFNMLDRDEIFRENVVQFSDYHQPDKPANTSWSLETGYSSNEGEEFSTSYPYRAYLPGAPNGLKFTILTDKNELDFACKDSPQGYRVVLHTPMRMPRLSQQYFMVPLNEAVVAAVTPDMISTSKAVQKYNARKRRCYFQRDRHLKYFKIYSALNCEMECLTNYTLESCGCVNFFMPRENGTKLCDTTKIACMKKSEELMDQVDLYIQFNNPSEQELNRSRWVDCDCLPICSDLTYNVEISQSRWDWMKQIKARNTMNNHPTYDRYHLSSLTIYFKSRSFIASERNELYGAPEFVANFGGLLGLFTGFSVLSLMEIIYFLTVRLICNCRLYGFWAGPKND